MSPLLSRLILPGATVAAGLLALVSTARAAGQDAIVGNSGMCLGDGGGRARQATMQECSGGAAQSWEYLPESQQLRLKGTGMCLNAAFGATGNGTPLILYPCGTPAYANERWLRERLDDGRTRLRGVGSDRCVNVPGALRTPGTQLVLWDCADLPNDLWFSAWGELLDIPLRVYAATNADGTASGVVTADLTAAIDGANATLARAGLRYVWDQQVIYRAAERVNVEGSGASSLELDVGMRRMASEDVHHVPMVLKSWGGGWSSMSERFANLPVFNDYFTVPSHKLVRLLAGTYWDQALTPWMVIHEGGHYLGLGHTAPDDQTPDHPEWWDADGLADTAPDPTAYAFRALWLATHPGGDSEKHECDNAPGADPDALIVDGQVLANPDKGNAMSYYDCKRPVRLTPQQITRMRTSLWQYQTRMQYFTPVIDRAPVVDVAAATLPTDYALFAARGDGVLELRESADARWDLAEPTVVGVFGRPIRVGALAHAGILHVLVTAVDTGQMWVGWRTATGFAWQEWTNLPEPMIEAVGTSTGVGNIFALGRSGRVYRRAKLSTSASAGWSRDWTALPITPVEKLAVTVRNGTPLVLGMRRTGNTDRLVRWSPGMTTWATAPLPPTGLTAPNLYDVAVTVRSDGQYQLALAGSGDGDDSGKGAITAAGFLANYSLAPTTRQPTAIPGEGFPYGALDLAAVALPDGSVRVAYAYPVDDLRLVTVSGGGMSEPIEAP